MNTFPLPRQIPATLLVVFSLLMLAPDTHAAPPKRRGPIVIYTVQGSYQDAVEALLSAITDQGIVISNVLHASDMLNRTGPDLGITKNVYLHATTYEFCSSILSHALVSQDPANMMACPYAIGVYQTTNQPDSVHLAFRVPQGVPGSEPTTARIQQLLETIIDATLEFL